MHLRLATAGLFGLANAVAHSSADAATEPCAQVANSPASGRIIVVSADLALACLRSVPLDKQGGMAQLQGVKTALQFQTTHAYLKDPPPGYLYPAVDLFAGLDSIVQNLSNDKYANEYDLQTDVQTLFASARDLHVQYSPPCADVFAFNYDSSSALEFVSVSPDGLQIPKIYRQSDVKAHRDLSGIAAVTMINGVNVEQWLNQYTALNGDSQEPDGNYNKLFQTVIGQLYTGTLEASLYPITENLTVTFDDGTAATHQPQAFVQYNYDFSGVSDGQSYFDQFCSGRQQNQRREQEQKLSGLSSRPQPLTQMRSKHSALRNGGTQPVRFEPVKQWTTRSSPSTYPPAVVLSQDTSVGGYFLDDNTTAVLAFTNFAEYDEVDAQNQVRQFLATCYSQKKTKLIIDLRGNTGGIVFAAFDIFKQLFPDLEPYGISNFRAHPLLHDLLEIVADYYLHNPDKVQDSEYFFLTSYRLSTWQNIYGPVIHHGDNFTTAVPWNQSDLVETGGFSVTDYNDEKGYNTVTVFDPENIVLLQDGGCSSTCTIFSELMKTQGHVRQIAFGGRAQEGPMQGVGGVKGSNVYELSLIQGEVASALENYATDDQKQNMQTKYPDLVANLDQATKLASVARVNVRNQIRHGDEDMATPLQFVYEASDCRRFYTADQLYDQTYVWEATVDAIWGNGGCVEGSTNQPSSQVLTGQDELIAPPDSAEWNHGFPDLKPLTLKNRG